MRREDLAAVLLSGGLVGAVAAQPAAELFGTLDLALTRTSGGPRPSQSHLGNGGLAASSLGFTVQESLGSRVQLRAVIEHGFEGDTGAASDATRRSFNRQAWLGALTPFGEFRTGRQASPLYEAMTQLDVFGARAPGSFLVNAGGFSERFDDLASWRATRWGLRWHVAFAPGEQQRPIEYGRNRYVAGIEGDRGPWHAALIGVQQNSADTGGKIKSLLGGVSRRLGTGRVYAALFRGNDNGADADLNLRGRYHTGWSLSVDHRWAERWTFGALAGAVIDTTPLAARAHQVSALARHDLSRRTALYAIAARLTNKGDARFGFESVVPPPSTPGAVSALQLGLKHAF